MEVQITPVILSGGSGTRLWPLSLPAHPKQLQALIGSETMIQATVRRLSGLEGVTAPIVVCNEIQAETISRQLAEIDSPPLSVLVEPSARNTAPAVAAAALTLDPESIMAVFPADHVIVDTTAFQIAVEAAVAAAANGKIVTFGVVPTRPDTGFGYIKVGPEGDRAHDLRGFVEKPDLATAEGYIADGGYLWNSGMFVFTAGAVLGEMERYAPDVLRHAKAGLDSATTGAGLVRLGLEFSGSPAISIDYAVMEQTDTGAVVPLDAGWSDLGSWQALWETAGDGDETVVVGQVLAVDSARSYLRSESRPVAVIGVDDVVVVETPDAILVMDRRRAQDVRLAADWFKTL